MGTRQDGDDRRRFPISLCDERKIHNAASINRRTYCSGSTHRWRLDKRSRRRSHCRRGFHDIKLGRQRFVHKTLIPAAFSRFPFLFSFSFHSFLGSSLSNGYNSVLLLLSVYWNPLWLSGPPKGSSRPPADVQTARACAPCPILSSSSSFL